MERVQNTSELFDAYQELFFSLVSSMYLTSVHLGAAKFVFNKLEKVKRLCSEGKTNLDSFKEETTRKNNVMVAMEDLTPSPRKRSIPEIITGISANEENISRGNAQNKQAKQPITVHAVQLSSDSEVEAVEHNASQSSSSLSIITYLTTSSQKGKTDKVQNAIWPLLYPYKTMCESSVENGNARMSLKRAFILKVLSPVVDYSMDYALLQFNYDRWLYETISGAIEAGRRFKCNPYKSLDGKSFSLSYWKWQHLHLEDAGKHFGPPTIFITVSPCEWTFPLPKLLEHFHDENG
ncbi:unnamed protein product [Clavelina lepadiformis]|uniref:Uncharacterized protein n=1 Tax=Clavelina lepadiformis TaxID=159417 RepID=A0ABP0GDU5_CLALP